MQALPIKLLKEYFTKKWTCCHHLLTIISFLSYVEHEKKDILKNQQLLVPIDYGRLWKSMGTINCLITSILQNIFFYVQHKKETHTGLERNEGE